MTSLTSQIGKIIGHLILKLRKTEFQSLISQSCIYLALLGQFFTERNVTSSKPMGEASDFKTPEMSALSPGYRASKRMNKTEWRLENELEP